MKLIFVFALCVQAQDLVKTGTFEGSPSLVLANDKLQLTMLPKGGNLVELTLQDDAEKNSPLWNPSKMGRLAGKKPRGGAGGGHFVCVDGFGDVSPQEKAAGLPGHGEAHRQDWTMTSSEKKGGTLSVSFAVDLPLVHEKFRRTMRMVDGESVVYVESELESLLAFDRPIFWAEHATVGSPFLAPGKTAVDVSASRSKTRTHIDEKGPNPPRLKDFTEFTWPHAPGVDGGIVDVRVAPLSPKSLDHTTSLMDPSRKTVFLTALNFEKHLLIGYVFQREEYPWLQCWDNYTSDGDMARGIEFGTMPFDVPRREALDKGPLFGTPQFRWLPAKGTIASKFLFFYTRVPDSFTKIDDVVLEHGQLTIKSGSRTVKLAASRGL